MEASLKQQNVGSMSLTKIALPSWVMSSVRNQYHFIDVDSLMIRFLQGEFNLGSVSYF